MMVTVNISRKLIANAIVSLLLIPVFAYILSYSVINKFGVPDKKPQTIRFTAYSKLPVAFQFFYNDPDNGVNDFSEDCSMKYKITKTKKPVIVEFPLPKYIASSKIRIDFGSQNNNTVAISDIIIEEENGIKRILVQRIAKNFNKSHNLTPPETKGSFLVYTTKGNDPYIIVDNLLPEKKVIDFIPENITGFTWTAACIAALFFFVFLIIITRKESESSYSYHKIIFVSLIWVTLMLPLWGLRYDIDKEWKAEKRKLAEKKPFDKQRMFEYPANYNKYFADNFGYRKLFIYNYNYILYKIFNQSPLPDKITLGDDKWMFYTSYPELLKIKYYTDEQLLTIKMNLEKRKKYFDKLGIKFYVMVAPEKINIYREHFPGFNPDRHTVHKLKQLEQYLKENSDLKIFVNPTEKMLASKGKNVLYYKQDTHWNDLGAFIGYSCLMDLISKDFPEIPVLSFNDFNIVEKTNQKANISAMIGIDTTWKTGPHLEFRQKTQSFQISKYKYSDDEYAEVEIKKHTNKNLPNILVFHDSYGKFVIPYISESFSRSVFVFTGYIDESIVAREKPDIVVYELTEGRINLLLKY